jgi:hypothetical protein
VSTSSAAARHDSDDHVSRQQPVPSRTAVRPFVRIQLGGLSNTVVNINSHTHDSDRVRAAKTGRLAHRYGLVPYPGRVSDLAAHDEQVNVEPQLKYGSGRGRPGVAPR